MADTNVLSRQSRKRRQGIVDPPDSSALDVPTSVPSSAAKRMCSDPGLPSPDRWNNTQVVEYLKRRNFHSTTCEAFREHNISGRHLTCIDATALQQMGISDVGTQLDLCKVFQEVDICTPLDEKIFNDPIHGHIELHPLLVKIIDTPEFQRLRRIKQLGGTYYVFPGASHNRFEHSIGVGHLAREFVESLQRRQPELNITNVDCLCVCIAGLCHDLGHGPFSHMFDGIFLPKARSDKKWKHEQGSVDMFDHLLAENHLEPEFERYGLDKDDIVFIKELIGGPETAGLRNGHENEISESPSWKYRGRAVEKSFLYEIVANKRNGIDVDKWDYFARDCHCLGIPNNFDQRRYVKFARVIEVNGERQICCRDKEVTNLYEMFHTRTGLHRRAYQHKTSKIVDLMVSEALLAADKYFTLPGKGGNRVRISESVEDMYAFTHLHDGVLDQILVTQDPQLDKAKKLLHLVERRQLYKYIGQTQPSEELEFNEEEIQQAIVDAFDCDELKAKGLPKLSFSDIVVQVVTFDYGMKEKNPIDQMRFYTKDNPDHAFKIRKDQVSQFLPHIFIEKHIRVYSRSRDPLQVKAAELCFRKWCSQQENLITPKGEFNLDEESDWTPYGTPMKDSNPATENLPDQQHSLGDIKKRLFIS